MSNDALEKLKQFELILKKCIINYFNGVLSQDKIEKINNSSYINLLELKKLSTFKDVQGYLLKSILNDIINVKCNKEININNDMLNIKYGELLESLLIEYFSIDISKKYKFDINQNHELENKLFIINTIKNTLKNDFKKIVINSNSVEILKNDDFKEIRIFFDKDAIIKYKKKNTQTVTPPIDNKIVENTNKIENNEKQKNILSKDEYEKICMKYARGEELSDEEYKALLISTPDLITEEEINKLDISTPKLVLESNSGFSYKAMIIYFIIITNILGFIIATLIFKY